MQEPYVTVFRDAEGYYEEKKSRFLSNVFHVKSEEEAEARLSEIRKRHYDARHHCYAYVLGEKRDRAKCSDDGEPQKTAGLPILSVLNAGSVTDTLIVVTRYFGGTLLGTGGLVRAYTKAAQDGLKKAGIIEKKRAILWAVGLSYDDHNRIRRMLEEQKIPPSGTEYADRVTVKIPVPLEKSAEFSRKITDLTQNRAIMEEQGTVCYAVINGETVLFKE